MIERLEKHIEELDSLMKQKGYDGLFLCNSCYPDNLKDSIKRHLLEHLQGSTHVPPFYLTTYASWKSEADPYVQCNFKVVHDHNEGFNVIKADIKFGNCHHSLKSIEKAVKNNQEIPHKYEAIAMVSNRVKVKPRLKL